ncbi:MAG: class I tRNA ligase family protein [Patescibacteria group bacterium]
MYSRFITMALHDWGYLDFEEPFPHFYAHGLVIKDGAKMSKSKGNVVNPDEYIALYGADALRLYLMFMGPFDQGGDFRDAAMEGMARWVNRVWRLGVKSEKLKVKSENQEITRALHKLVKKVTEDIEKRRYNTAIAAMMEFTNLVEDQSGILDYNSLKTFILLLAPFAPHLAEELWQRLAAAYRRAAADGEHWSVHLQPWPSFDPKIVEEDTVEIVVQVNGKLRDTCHLSHVTCHNQSEVEKLARESEKIRKYLAGQTVKKVIFVPGKLMNFVI